MNTSVLANKISNRALSYKWVRISLGSLLLCLAAQFVIPVSFAAVPITLQTLAVSLLAITLGPKEAPLSTALYLFFACLGFPVLQSGKVNSFWFLEPTAGYLFGFLFSSYLVAKLLTCFKPRSFFKSWLLLSLNEGSVLLIGSLWLSYFLGLEKSFFKGFLPFLPGALVKISLAAIFYKIKSKKNE